MFEKMCCILYKVNDVQFSHFLLLNLTRGYFLYLLVLDELVCEDVCVVFGVTDTFR